MTVATDDGRVQWRELSRREKAARATQQTFNFGLIVGGIVMTVRDPKYYIKTKELMKGRVVLSISCTPKSSRQTARPVISIAPLTGFVPILELLNCSAPATRFGLLESRHGTGGAQQDRSRE